MRNMQVSFPSVFRRQRTESLFACLGSLMVGSYVADLTLQKLQSAEDLKRYLSIPRRLIFESSVRVGTPSLAAAPAGPDTRPRLSASAASIMFLSCWSNSPLRAVVRRGTSDGSRLSHVSSTAKVSASLRMTARSITFCSSRMLPGHSYSCKSFSDFLSIVLNCFPVFFPNRAMKYSTSNGISIARSRNEGISMGTTFSLYSRS